MMQDTQVRRYPKVMTVCSVETHHIMSMQPIAVEKFPYKLKNVNMMENLLEPLRTVNDFSNQFFLNR